MEEKLYDPRLREIEDSIEHFIKCARSSLFSIYIQFAPEVSKYDKEYNVLFNLKGLLYSLNQIKQLTNTYNRYSCDYIKELNIDEDTISFLNKLILKCSNIFTADQEEYSIVLNRETFPSLDYDLKFLEKDIFGKELK